MKNIFYKILRLATSDKLPAPMKLAGLWAMHLLRRRTIGVFIDPTMGCNLRCRMCYFSDAERRAKLSGIMDRDDISRIANGLFHRALKLQIGCGAEPTLYPHLKELVERGKKAGVPYISLTTNGQLIATGRVDLEQLAAAGLNEITLSMHGTEKEVYEFLMPGAKFENLCKLIEIIDEVRRRHPNFKLRVNFTVNSMNIRNLGGYRFWQLWEGKATPDIIQLRPVQDFGNCEWKDFDRQPLKDSYDETFGAIIAECKRRGITCVAPTRDQIDRVNDLQDSVSSIIEDLSYCYVSPDSCYKADFDRVNDTYETYHKRSLTSSRLFKSIFTHNRSRNRNVSKKLNYKIK